MYETVAPVVVALLAVTAFGLREYVIDALFGPPPEELDWE